MSPLEKYKSLRPKIEAFSLRLKNLLVDIAELHDLDIHIVEHRAKSIDSFNNKLNLPGKDYRDPLNEITDLCGLRVIFYYQDDVNKFCSAIYDEFDIDEENSVNKLDELNSDQFGYMSTHIVCKLSHKRADLFEWSKYADIKFEIQVRTVLQHAWASISHAIEYKSKVDTPKPLARQLNRIAGLLELSDEQFLELRTKSNDLKVKISESTSGIYDDIDVLTIENYLNVSQTVKAIALAVNESELNLEGLGGEEELIYISKAIGYKTVNEIDGALNENVKNLKFIFNEFYNTHTAGRYHLVSGSIAHWCAVTLLLQQKVAVINKLKKRDVWSPSYFQSIIETIKK